MAAAAAITQSRRTEKLKSERDRESKRSGLRGVTERETCIIVTCAVQLLARIIIIVLFQSVGLFVRKCHATLVAYYILYILDLTSSSTV